MVAPGSSRDTGRAGVLRPFILHWWMLWLVLLPLPLTAQNYLVSDTVTEYPNKGTFYHDRFEGRKTASGEVFDQNKFTAAHWRIKLGTYVMVTNRNTGLQVIVKVNDRCPKRGVFDMSHRAATAIGIRGMQPVTVRILPDGYEDQWAAQETKFDSVRSRLSPQAQPASVAIEKQQPIVATPKNVSGDWGLLLGKAASHSEVFSLIRRLPASYRDMAGVETIEASDSLRVTLDLRTTRKQAEQTARTLRSTFPQVKVIPSESDER